MFVKKAKEHTQQHAKKRVSVKRSQSNIETENDKKEVVPLEKKGKSDSQNCSESDDSSEASWSDFNVYLDFNKSLFEWESFSPIVVEMFRKEQNKRL